MQILTLSALWTLAFSSPSGFGPFQRELCLKDLPPQPNFEFSHLTVPISQFHQDVANRNTYFPSITAGDLATVFNFDILHADQTCELGFYFPRQDQLGTSSFTFSDHGTFVVSINQPGTGAQDGVTTWNSQPPAGFYAGFPKTVVMSLGNYFSFFTGPCPVGL